MSQIRKRTAILLVFALVVSSFVGFVGVGTASAAGDQLQRIAGADRFETAAKIAEAKYPSGSNTVIVARSDDFADGLAASVLAGALNAPVLLTKSNELPQATTDAIKKLGAKKVIVLGSEVAISKNMEDALKNAAGEVERIGGADRVETAVKIAQKAKSSAEVAFIVNGWTYADAMTAGAAAFAKGYPVLAVRANELPAAVKDALKALGVKQVVIVGGETVVSAKVAQDLAAAGVQVSRIAGSDRVETSVEFAKSQFANASGYSVVNGWNLADAVGAAVFANPILYTYTPQRSNDLPASVSTLLQGALNANAGTKLTVFGGPVAVSDAVYNQLTQLINNAVFQVVSITAINQKMIQVKLNKPVDKTSALNAANYAIDGVKLNSISGAYAVLEADKQTVNIYLGTALNQDQKVTVSVTGLLEDKTYKKAADYSATVTVRDTANPLLANVELKNGNKDLYLIFNEALDATNVSDLDSYTLNGQALSTFGATAVAFDQTTDNTTGTAQNRLHVVKISFASKLPNGTYTIAVKENKLKDPAGFYAVNQKLQFTVTDDTAPFTVASTVAYAGTPGKIEIKFNKNLGTLVSGYWVNDVSVIPSLKTGTKDTIILTATVYEGANLVIIPGAQRDEYGNKIGENDLRISVNGVKDTVKPRVENVYALSDKQVRVKFSEGINVEPFVSAKANYTIKEADGTVIYSAAVNAAGYSITPNVGGDASIVDINFTNALPGSNYVIEIKGLRDGAGNEMEPFTGSFISPDKTAPTLAKPPANKAYINPSAKLIEIFFSEPMDVSTITNRTNYLYTTDSTTYNALPVSATLEAGTGNKSVKITFPGTVDVTAIKDIKVLNVKDVAGNLINGGSDNTGVPKFTSGVQPKLVGGTAVATADSDKVTITFNTDQQITKIDKADFANIFTGTKPDGTTVSVPEPDTAVVSGKTITLTYNSSNAGYNAIKVAGNTLAFSETTFTNTENAYGDDLTTNGVSAEGRKVKDQITPELVATNPIKVVSANQIELTFNENMSNENQAEVKDDVIVTIAGATTSITQVSATANKITLTTKDSMMAAQKVTLQFVEGKISMKDVAGNVFVPTTDQKKTWQVTVAAATATTLTATNAVNTSVDMSDKSGSLEVIVDGKTFTAVLDDASFSDANELLDAIKAAVDSSSNVLSTVVDVSLDTNNKIVITHKTAGSGKTISIKISGTNADDVKTLTGFDGTEIAVPGTDVNGNFN